MKYVIFQKSQVRVKPYQRRGRLVSGYGQQRREAKPSIDSEGKTLPEGFWEWFRNSKIVDKEGRPLLMYRGGEKGGYWFTNDPKGAKGYGKVNQFYLKVENPKEIDMEGKEDNDLYVFEAPDAEEEGHDGLVARNVDDGRRVFDQYAIFDLKNVWGLKNGQKQTSAEQGQGSER